MRDGSAGVVRAGAGAVAPGEPSSFSRAEARRILKRYIQTMAAAMNLSEEQRGELIDYYFQLKQKAGHDTAFADYKAVLDACAAQRLMQALGAYGFLGHVKGKRHFLEYMAGGQEALRALLRESGQRPTDANPDLPGLTNLI